MTKQDIFRIALDCFNINIEELVIEPDEEHAEVSPQIRYCETFYRNAEISCSKLFEWSFLYNFRQYEDKDLYEPLSDPACCNFAYPVPENFSSPIFVNGIYNQNIKRLGAYLIFTVKNPSLTYIIDKLDFDNWIYPDDYGYLVAYKLAMEIQPNVAPDTNMLSGVMQKYGLVYTQLKTAEVKVTRNKNPSPSIFVV